MSMYTLTNTSSVHQSVHLPRRRRGRKAAETVAETVAVWVAVLVVIETEANGVPRRVRVEGSESAYVHRGSAGG